MNGDLNGERDVILYKRSLINIYIYYEDDKIFRNFQALSRKGVFGLDWMLDGWVCGKRKAKIPMYRYEILSLLCVNDNVICCCVCPGEESDETGHAMRDASQKELRSIDKLIGITILADVTETNNF